MHQIEQCSSIFLIVFSLASALAAESQIKGPTVARPSETIVLLVPKDVANDSLVIVLRNNDPIREGEFKFADNILTVDKAKEGNYLFLVKHGDQYLTKTVLVAQSATSRGGVGKLGLLHKSDGSPKADRESPLGDSLLPKDAMKDHLKKLIERGEFDDSDLAEIIKYARGGTQNDLVNIVSVNDEIYRGWSNGKVERYTSDGWKELK